MDPRIEPLPMRANEELWILQGTEPVIWGIPYYVSWFPKSPEGQLISCRLLLRKEEAAAEAVLKTVGRKSNGIWFLTLDELQKVAVKSPGGDPEVYFHWDRERFDNRPESKQAKAEDNDEFLRWCYQMNIGRDPGEVAWWFNQFKKLSAEWLINKEKPLDLGFVKLHNSPYRVNWLTILASRFPNLGKSVSAHGDGASLDDLLHRSGFMEELLSLDLLAIHSKKTHFCYRHIEVEHTKTWWKMVERAEYRRLLEIGPIQYASRLLGLMRSKIRVAITLYRSWISQAARPSACIDEGSIPRGVSLVPHIPIARKRATAPGHWPIPGVIPNKLETFTPASAEEDLLVAHGRMPAVPFIPPTDKDVRRGGPDVDKSQDRAA